MKIPSADLDKIISFALKEDACDHDVTSQLLVSNKKVSEAYICAREGGIICGLSVIRRIFAKLDKTVKFLALCKDGQRVKPNAKIAYIKGKTRALLAGERTALNFLGHLSGIATKTNLYVQKIRPSKAKILDTRKTTPGLRVLEKYAVHCGGGENHRLNLQDMVLIKDNHRQMHAQLDSLVESIRRVRKQTRKPIEVEVDTITEFKEILKAKPNIVLLDNMNTRQLKQAVQINKKTSSNRRPLLEASGGITLKNVRTIAKTGVDRISIGALTHSTQALDVAMDMVN